MEGIKISLTCCADSGGLIEMILGGNRVLIALTSFGRAGFCGIDYPDSFEDWIKCQMLNPKWSFPACSSIDCIASLTSFYIMTIS